MYIENISEEKWAFLTSNLLLNITSRDRPKSAPYLRLKNSKRTSKCQSIGEFGTFYEKKF